MPLSRIAPELHAPVRRLPSLPLRWTPVRRLARALTARLPATETPGVTIGQPVPGVRLYRPERQCDDAAVLWIHGGGLVLGAARMDDRLCGGTAAELGVVVVSVEYRLAPEAPFPAALDDCHAAWTWLREQAGDLGVDPDRVVVGGQSAGGGLAAALAQRLHDEGGGRPLAQWLWCPMLDDRTAARRELDAVGHRVWDNRANLFGWRSYLGAVPGAPDAPEYAVPARRADLTGLPSAWIGVGDIDLFQAEDIAYAERLRAAGIPVEVRVVPGAPHGFEAWAPDAPISREHIAAARDWLRGVVTESGRRTP